MAAAQVRIQLQFYCHQVALFVECVVYPRKRNDIALLLSAGAKSTMRPIEGRSTNTNTHIVHLLTVEDHFFPQGGGQPRFCDEGLRKGQRCLGRGLEIS